MRLLHCLLLSIFCCLSLEVYAQNQKNLDTLLAAYHNAAHDTAKVIVLTKISTEYARNKPDTCIAIAQKALRESEKIGFQTGKGLAFNSIAVGYITKGKHTEALTFLQESLAILTKIQVNQDFVAIVFNNIGLIYQAQSNYPLALEYYQKSLKIKEAGGNKQALALGLVNIGNIYSSQGSYPQALAYYQKSLKLQEEIGDKSGSSSTSNNIGIIHSNQGNLAQALLYFQQSLQIKEELGDKQGMARSLNNIGVIYEKQSNYQQALVYHQRSLEIKEQLGDKQGIASSFSSIGSIYKKQKNYAQAITYYQKGLQLREEIKDKRGESYSLNGLAEIAQEQQNYDKSVEYAQKSLKIAQEIKALAEIKNASEVLYQTYKLQADYAKALLYFELAKQTNDSLFNVEKSKAIANLEAKTQVERKEKEIELLNKNKALLEKDNQLQRIENERQRNAKMVIEKQAEADRLLSLAQQEQNKRKQDSLLYLAQQRQVEAEQLKIKEKQLQTENRAKELENQQAQEEKQFQQIIIALVTLSLLGALVLLWFIWKNRQKVYQANKEIRIKNNEISQQKEALSHTLQVVELQKQDIEYKNQEITASITYALRIQNAILRTEIEMQKYLDCFVFFRPRDIVSGDFYWFTEKENCKILAVADCTGHGVSGALMTMIGNNLLNQIVHDKEIHEPDQILVQLQILLEKTLTTSQQNVKDGMDISIVRLSYPQGFKSSLGVMISYAGAMNPLYYVENQEFKEIKADKLPIGGRQSDKNFVYQQHNLQVSVSSNPLSVHTEQQQITDNYVLYLCSDGYQDQFGGENDKKFMVKNLKRLLLEISDKPLPVQKDILATTFDDWKGKREQTDDVLVVGVKI